MGLRARAKPQIFALRAQPSRLRCRIPPESSRLNCFHGNEPRNPAMTQLTATSTLTPVSTSYVARPQKWLTREDLRFPLILFLTNRIALICFSYVGMTLVPTVYLHEAERQKELMPHKWIDGFCRWDCGWFERLAREGYSTAANANVWPLYPWIGHAVEYATGLHRLYVLIIVANLASLGSYIVIYRLFRELSDRNAARWGLLLMVAYPFAYNQAAGYPESLMVFSSALSLSLFRRKEHLLAGNVLGLGVMCRHITIFYGASLLAAHVRQQGFSPRRLLISRGFLGLLIPLLYIGLYSLHLQRKLGDPIGYIHARSIGFGPEAWYSVLAVWRHVTFEQVPEYYVYQACALIPFIGTLALFTRRRWIELAFGAAALMTVICGCGAAGLGRYSASCWPAFLPLGVWLSRRPLLQTPIVGALMLLQGLFVWLFMHQWQIL